MMGTSSLELHWLSDAPGLWLRDADLVPWGMMFPGPSGWLYGLQLLLPGSARPAVGSCQASALMKCSGPAGRQVRVSPGPGP